VTRTHDQGIMSPLL